MDVAAYASLGLAGMILISTIALVFWCKSLSDRYSAAQDALLTYVRDSAQKELDAEHAKADLVTMTADRDAQRALVQRLNTFVSSTHGDQNAKPLPPDDLLDRVVGVSSAAGANVPAGGANPGTPAIAAVPGR